MEAWGSEGLTEEVQRREELRELVADLGKLPESQRAALVLSELEALSHAQIAQVLQVDTAKVRSLVFQARGSLISTREARDALRRNQVPALDAHGLVAATPHVAPPRPGMCRLSRVRGGRTRTATQLRPDPSRHRRSRPARRCAAVRVRWYGGRQRGSRRRWSRGRGSCARGRLRRRRRGWCARRTRGSRRGQRSCPDHRGRRDRRHGHCRGGQGTGRAAARHRGGRPSCGATRGAALQARAFITCSHARRPRASGRRRP